METRSQTEVWLIGQGSMALSGHTLPSKKQVLQTFFYHKKDNNIRQSATIVTQQVLIIWNKARIPTKQPYHVVAHVEKLFDKYCKLKKNKGRDSLTQHNNEQAFIEEIEQLFDIAHENAMTSITLEEDRQFLQMQRDSMKGYMGALDTELAQKEERITERKAAVFQRQVKESERKSEADETVELVESDTDDNDEDGNDDMRNSGAFCPSKKVKTCPPEGKKKVINPEVCSVLDRLKIPNHSGSLLVSTVAHGLGIDLEACSTSYESVRRAQLENRQQVALEVKSSFNPTVPLTVHWDGKLLPDLTGRNTVDRLPILVTGYGIEKLLAAPKLDSGTGEQMSSATIAALNDWSIPAERIAAICFDTTSSNTGIHVGACTLLEQELGKSVLYLACRHHVHEIVLSHVYKTCFGTSSGPEIKLFERFRNEWSKFQHDSWLTEDIDPSIYGDLITKAVQFAQKALLHPS